MVTVVSTIRSLTDRSYLVRECILVSESSRDLSHSPPALPCTLDKLLLLMEKSHTD